MVDIDEELAELLKPITFSLEECRAKSRAARTESERSSILLGERLVKQSQAERAKKQLQTGPERCPTLLPSTSQATGASAAAYHIGKPNWTAEERANIAEGKRAAQRMLAEAATRKSVRKSKTRKAKTEARSSAKFLFGTAARNSLGPEYHCNPKMSFTSIKQLPERYDMTTLDSARSMVSSMDGRVGDDDEVLTCTAGTVI